MRWRVLARSGAWRALVGSGTLGGLARAGGARRTLGLWRILGAVVRAGGLWHAVGALARVGGFGVPWRLTRSRLCLGWCCGLRVAPGFLFAGLLAVANAMFYFALTWLEYTGCGHMRA